MSIGKLLSINRVVSLPSSDSGLQHSIVRLNNFHIDAKKQNPQCFFRREPVVIINRENNLKILRYVMGNPGSVSIAKNAIAVDYDAVDALSVNYKHSVELELRRAKISEVFCWFWSHPDLGIQLSIRLGFIGAGLGVMGFITGLITAFL